MQAARKAVGNAAFSLGYNLYKSRVGSWLHSYSSTNKPPHSRDTSFKLGLLTVHVVPILGDNYSYVIVDNVSRTCVCVDPADSNVILDTVKQQGLTVTAVLTTHSHWDHAGGNAGIAAAVPGVAIYGSEVDKVDALTHPVKQGDSFDIGALRVRVLDVPCHTRGHVVYIASHRETTPAVAFTGDTLFQAGCGRFFEGNADEMKDNMCQLAQLATDTIVCCGHEYSVTNMKFSMAVEPDNGALRSRMEEWLLKRRGGEGLPEPTVPSTIGDEMIHNPFLRAAVSDPKLSEAVCALLPRLQGEGLACVQGMTLPPLSEPTFPSAAIGVLRVLKDNGWGVVSTPPTAVAAQGGGGGGGNASL